MLDTLKPPARFDIVQQGTKTKGKQMAKYQVEVQLSGEDGNAFAIMGRVQSALKRAGATKEELDQYFNESTAGDFDNLLRVACQWVEVS